MKFCVIIPSRGNPEGLKGAVESMRDLASGKHQVEFGISADEDDGATIDMAHSLGATVSVGPRIPYLGALYNRLLPMIDADVYTSTADDVIYECPDWDRVLALFMRPDGLYSTSFSESGMQLCTTPTVSRKWVELAGYYFPEKFPFWFVDTWVAEVYELLSGRRMTPLPALRYTDKRGPTRRMRDLEFWSRYFAFTRTERVAMAVRMAEAVGRKAALLPESFERFTAHDNDLIKNMEALKETFGGGEKLGDGLYQIAYDAAQKEMAA